MKASVYSKDLLIGATDFKKSFGSMGHIWGYFYPSGGYEAIKMEVQEFCSASQKNEQDFAKWDALRFNVQLENGYFILPIGGYEIFDFPDNPNEKLEMHLAGINSHIYVDYFENNKPFLLSPWTPINITEKIELEDMLLNLIVHDKLIVSALAKNEVNNTVLFAVHGIGRYLFIKLQRDINHQIIGDGVSDENNYFFDFDDFTERQLKLDSDNLSKS